MKKIALALFIVFAQTHAHAALADIDTNYGKIQVQLDEKRAPRSVASFRHYAEKGFYNGTIFHRVIPGFMIQGGGLTPNLIEKPTDGAIANEAGNGLKNQKFTVAMARKPDPNSASAQFFINVKDNDFLNHKNNSPADYGYAVFGKVVRGQDVVMKIASAPTHTAGMYENVPVKPVIIRKITFIH